MSDNKRIESPWQLSSSGWKTVLLRVKDEIADDNVGIVAAGVAFFSFLAIFPALAAIISIYGLAFDPQQVQQQILKLASLMPEQALDILRQQLQNLVSSSGQALGWGAGLGILFSLWSAKKGVSSLFIGLDIAYGVKSTRGFIKQNAIGLVFTLGGILLVILSVILIAVFPAFVGYLGLPLNVENLITWLRWVLLALIVVGALLMVYKYGPARPAPHSKWVMPGALFATFLWLIASWGFSFYVSNFGSYGEMYGSISAVVVFMLWLVLSSFIVLLGAELNSEIWGYSRKELKPTWRKPSE